jgi:phenol 2-monooxygenase
MPMWLTSIHASLSMPNETSGQADGIQPRMLEIWESLGIGKSLREKSEHVYRMVISLLNNDNDTIF